MPHKYTRHTPHFRWMMLALCACDQTVTITEATACMEIIAIHLNSKYNGHCSIKICFYIAVVHIYSSLDHFYTLYQLSIYIICVSCARWWWWVHVRCLGLITWLSDSEGGVLRWSLMILVICSVLQWSLQVNCLLAAICKSVFNFQFINTNQKCPWFSLNV